MRFRIFELLAFVSIAAFALAALRRSDFLVESLFFSLTLLIVLGAILVAVSSRSKSQIFWTGFAIASCAYLIYAHRPDANELVPRHTGPELTTQLLEKGYHVFFPDASFGYSSTETGGFFLVNDDPFSDLEMSAVDASAAPSNLSLIIDGGQQLESTGDSTAFMRIGHSACALFLGWVAAHFSQFVRDKTQPADGEAAES